MTGKTKKELKSAEQLIEHMKSKGIKFNIVSEKEAIDYLQKLLIAPFDINLGYSV